MSNPDRSSKQWVLAGGAICVAMFGLYFVAQVLNSSDSVLAHSDDSGVTSTLIAERTRAAAPEMSWINDASERLKNSQDRIELLEERYSSLEAQYRKDMESVTSQTDEVLAAYEKKIAELQNQISGQPGRHVNQNARQVAAAQAPLTGQRNVSGGQKEFVQRVAVPGASFRQSPIGAPGIAESAAQGIGAASAGFPTSARPFSTDFTLGVSTEPLTEKKAEKTLQNFLPAGSYAPAIVLSGVDAPTNVASQTDPIPVLFRITGPAVTAGTRSTNGHTIDLTGCTVTGSAKGDLSSERVLVRLLKLSCVMGNGRVFEEDVAGYMSGRGKAGARGHVVSREGPLVTNAGIAGALGGLADGISGVGRAGAEAENASFEDALRGAGASAASGGVGSAANTLSEYYIERAEQYQPVVSLYGGTNVELVFMEGVSLDG